MKYTISYDDAPPSANRNNSVGGRGNPHAIARLKGQWEGIFFTLMLAAKVPRPITTRIEATATLQFKTKHKRDVDNFYFAISKPLGDALQKGGWIPDDTPDWYMLRALSIETGVTDLRFKSRTIIELDIAGPMGGDIIR